MYIGNNAISENAVMNLAYDNNEMELIEAVAGASMDVDLHHFDPSDPDEMVLRALDDMIPSDLVESPVDDEGE